MKLSEAIKHLEAAIIEHGDVYPPTLAGKAIELNGFTITYVNTGMIHGAVS